MIQSESDFNRKIIISSGINNDVAREVVSRIMEINDFDEQMSVVSTYQPEPIEMFINSTGGVVSDGFAIIGAMEMSATPIITYGMGVVASMALGIFVKGDVRVAHRYARFMFHTVGYGVSGFLKDHEDQYKEAETAQRMYNDLFKETGLTSSKINEIREGKIDFFFSGKEAVALGIADECTTKPEKKIGLVPVDEDNVGNSSEEPIQVKGEDAK